MDLSRPVVVHRHSYLPICPKWACTWARNLSNQAALGPDFGEPISLKPLDGFIPFEVGLKRYAQTRIRYDTRYGAHDTICSVIRLPFLAGKQRLVIPACDQKHCNPPITTACAVMMRNGYNNGGLHRVSRCSVFVMSLLVLLEYTGCYLRYLIFVSNFGKCHNCTVSYHIFLRAYRDITIASVSVLYRCAGVSFQP